MLKIDFAKESILTHGSCPFSNMKEKNPHPMQNVQYFTIEV